MPSRVPMFCLSCGYRLDAVEAGTCPECERPFSPCDPTTWRRDEHGRNSASARKRMRIFFAGCVLFIAACAGLMTWSPVLGVVALVAGIMGVAVAILLLDWDILHPILKRDQGPTRTRREDNLDIQLAPLVGKEAVATQALRPVGNVRIDGETYVARCPIGSADVGEKLEVVGVQRGELIVRKA